MDTTTNPDPATRRGGPPGRAVLAVTICALILARVWHLPARVRDASGRLELEQGLWAVGMTAILLAAIASVRRGPAGGRWAGYCASGICLVGIGWTLVDFARVLLR